MTDKSADASTPKPVVLAERIDERLAGIVQWIEENAPEIMDEQKHLNAGSAERAYWHYGYAIALRDIRKCLAGKNSRLS